MTEMSDGLKGCGPIAKAFPWYDPVSFKLLYLTNENKENNQCNERTI
jgi:hypothetical protein